MKSKKKLNAYQTKQMQLNIIILLLCAVMQAWWCRRWLSSPSTHNRAFDSTIALLMKIGPIHQVFCPLEKQLNPGKIIKSVQGPWRGWMRTTTTPGVLKKWRNGWRSASYRHHNHKGYLMILFIAGRRVAHKTMMMTTTKDQQWQKYDTVF